ncbi:MAG TPA: hypothetical protein VLD62_08445 [Acidimicrobiia bacterium]|nr:hypothetical protein [Acidimicrobiia bacterium]
MTMTMTTTPRPTIAPTVDDFDAAYQRLVLAWEEHETLRHRRASFGALVESRAALQRARVEMARVRRVR